MPGRLSRGMFLLCATLAALLACIGPVTAQEKVAGPRWNADIRPLWSGTTTTPYIHSWLLCGPFQLQVPMLPPYDGARLNAASATDFLQDAGGEANIHPVEGMEVARPDGSKLKWLKYDKADGIINLTTAFGGKPVSGAVAYAYTTIHRDTDGKAYFAGSSDDGMRLWVNGKLVYDNLIIRGMFFDDDVIAVDLKAGDNTILIKVEQAIEYWAFCLRVVGENEVPLLLASHEAPKKIWCCVTSDAGQLVIRTDSGLDLPPVSYPPVDVLVTGAGGRVMVKQVARYRERLVFNSVLWPDGAYDVTCRMTRADGVALTAHQIWYKGDAWAAVQRLLATAPKPASPSASAMVHAMLVDMVNNRLNDDIAHVTPEQLIPTFSALAEFEEAQQLAAGGNGPNHPYGFMHLAYLDEVDGSPQFARLYLPANYDPSKKWPLIVNLHGYYPRNPSYARWWGSDRRFDTYTDQGDVITLYPHGRGNTSYVGIGDRDVLRCIAMAKERFSIDDDRVYLTGASMGGSGTWNVGTRHPELFAGIAPIYGGWDYRISFEPDELTKLTPAEKYRLEGWSTFAQLESLLTTPVLVNHGDADMSVNVDYSRYAVRQLQRWGYEVQYWEHPGKGHEALYCEDALKAWALARRRVTNPTHVRLRAVELKSASAHWVRVEQRDDPRAFVNVDAEIIAANTIRLDTENVLAITLSPRGPLIEAGKPLWVIWNSNDIRKAQLTNGRVTLNAPGYTPPTLCKRPELEGPASDTQNMPFAIVLGTSSPDPLMRKMCERMANRLSGDWERWQHWTPRQFKDSEITAADKAKYALWLVGGPEENSVTKEIAGKLPLAITPEAITLDGHASAKDIALHMAYPSPFNADRYVLVWAANSAAGMYFADYTDTDLDYGLTDGRDGFLAQGYFDKSWRFQEEYLEPGDAAARGKSPVRKAPVRISAQTPDTQLWLTELLETRLDGGFRSLVRDAAMTGKALRPGSWDKYAHGLAVPLRSNSFIEYDLTGAGWTRLHAVLGVEGAPASSTPEKARKNVQVVFIVKGDGKELYRSQPFLYRAAAQTVDVNISGIACLRLEITNLADYDAPVSSIDWADLRLEK